MHEKKNTILVIDDEPQVRKMLSTFLDASDFRTEESDCGRQAIRMCASIKPNLVLLELGLPDMDGKDVISEIRLWSHVPIVVLSTRTDDDEICAALDLGADDYVVKPFNTNVLMSRINANLRKAAVQQAGEPELVNGFIRMDLVRHEVYLEGKKVTMTPKEYDLLRFFMINRGKMLTHRQILHEIWGPAHGNDTQYVRVYVGQMRDKIEPDHSRPQLIITEPGVGYRMEVLPRPA
ncbi:MAG: response regulator transcription factor [Alphaproteobacteria bacterium]|nr:response regulator transcription factor [Alphaproteobacteria bacterium]